MENDHENAMLVENIFKPINSESEVQVPNMREASMFRSTKMYTSSITRYSNDGVTTLCRH
jgi:hypothetical protein